MNRAELSPAVEPDTNGHTGPRSPRTEDTDGAPDSAGLAVESSPEQAATPDEAADEVVGKGGAEDIQAAHAEPEAEAGEEVVAQETDGEEAIEEAIPAAAAESDAEIDTESDTGLNPEIRAGDKAEHDTADDVEIEASASDEPAAAATVDGQSVAEQSVDGETADGKTDEAIAERSDAPAIDLAEIENREEARVEEAEDESADAPEAEEIEPAERSALVMNAVKIRGRPGGVAIEIAEGEWAELLAVLQERLDMAEGFFRGGRVVLDLGERAVDEAELQQVVEILAGFEMEMAVVRAEAESTLEAAVALGITTSSGEDEDPLRNVTVSSTEAQAEEEGTQGPAYYVHQGNLRSGQVLQRAESVIVIGDVNPGAQVISNGDVLIWGRLRGSVHAGAEGDSEAMVTAMEFAPTQLRIAGLTSVPPEEQTQSRNFLFWKKNVARGAEFAYVGDGRIYVEPWNAARPGSLTARRRQ